MAVVIEITHKGFYTLPVTARRHGLERFGMPTGGPMDLCRYVLANRLVGNEDQAGALEFTAMTPGLVFHSSRAAAVVGGVTSVVLVRGGVRHVFPALRTFFVEAGDTLLPAMARGEFRGYLAVSGGVQVDSPRPLPLGNGDRVELGPRSQLPPARSCAKVALPEIQGGKAVLRVVAGVHRDHFSREGMAAFFRSSYTVTPQSSRMGIRFGGAGVSFAPGHDGNILSEAMLPGDIQVTSGGQPILMLADCQTVGGYAKAAHVIGADLPQAGQLRPGDQVEFRRVSLGKAQALWRQMWRDLETLPQVAPAPGP